MRITKGVITAAGQDQRRIPLQTLVDSDGVTRTVLAMLVREITATGIEDVGIVVSPGDEGEYSRAVAGTDARITFLPQTGPRGYAHALWCSREFVAGEPFLHLVGDHVYVRSNGRAAAQTVVETAKANLCSVSAVQATHESLITRFGVVGGRPVRESDALYQVEAVVEKPTPTEAETRLIVPGLRAGYYLAYFGMHVFTASVMDLIGHEVAKPSGASVSAALEALAGQQKYLVCRAAGDRYDLGARYGLFQAQLALTLSGTDRDEMLTSLCGMLASQSLSGAGSGAR